MSDVVIRVSNLGKRYQIGARQERYYTFRDTLSRLASAPLRWFQSNGDKESSESTIWALKDVSFEIKRGEVVGIIGRNGAGKSTLLKILSRITGPTEGRAEIHGRVGSLLEVGTGFHPELTGRENIYLNGAILGMKKAEIERKFDEIVAFAGVEKFIDTPVKHFSSGMYIRLAFAVAAHLESEILLVDEVLAVGDAQFQKRCLTKMQEIGRGGRTILFVSHNMAAMRNICRHGFVIDQGHLIEHGEINDVVDRYIAQVTEEQVRHGIVETESFVIDDVEIRSNKGPVIRTFDPVQIAVKFTAKTDILDPGLYVGILTLENFRLTGLDFKDFRTVPTIRRGEKGELGFILDTLPILHGTYQLEIHLKDMALHKFEIVPKMFHFDVIETPIYGGRKLDRWFGHIGLNARAISHATLKEEASGIIRGSSGEML